MNNGNFGHGSNIRQLGPSSPKLPTELNVARKEYKALNGIWTGHRRWKYIMLNGN